VRKLSLPRRFTASLAIGLSLLVGLAGPVAASVESPNGVWTGPDADGSTQILLRAPSGFSVYYDTRTSFCDTRFGEPSAALFLGRSSFDGSTLRLDGGHLFCLLSTGPRAVDDIVLNWNLDKGATDSPFDDLLVDAGGCSLGRPSGVAGTCS